MRALIRTFDRLVCRLAGVYEFSAIPECVLRLQVRRAAYPLHLPGHVVSAGAPVLLLHLWNERVPPLPANGADLAWALRAARLFVGSLHLVAAEMRRDPHLVGIEAVGAVTAHLLPAERLGGAHLLQRLGFDLMPYRPTLGRFGEFWEDAYTWSLIWAYNAPSLRAHRLLRLRRTELWMAADRFLVRYGEASSAHRSDGGTGTRSLL